MTEIIVSLLTLAATGLAAFFYGKRKAADAIEREAQRDYLQRKKDIEDALNSGGSVASDRDFLRARSER